MVVESATENIYEKCSGSGEHSNCWPHECIITSGTNQVAPLPPLASAHLERLMSRGAANYDDELRMALKLSVREEHQSQELQSAEKKEIRDALELSVKEKQKSQELLNTEAKEMEKALKLSLLEITKSDAPINEQPMEVSAMSKDEKKQLEIAIMASLEDVSNDTLIDKETDQDRDESKSLAWGQEERQRMEELYYIATPDTLDKLKNLMTAMEKPLRMWPQLYNLMTPLRNLLHQLLSLFQWEGEHYEAWEQAKRYMRSELSCTVMDIDTDDEETTTKQNEPNGKEPPFTAQSNEQGCKKPPMHPFCSIYLTKGAPMSGPNLGLSDDTMKALSISPPITTRVSVKNLAYGVNENKLHEVFSLCGNIVALTLDRYDHGESKGTATVQFAHPLEAIQAIIMFKHAKLLSRNILVEQDKVGPTPSISSKKLPDGLVDVDGGLGMGEAVSKFAT